MKSSLPYALVALLVVMGCKEKSDEWNDVSDKVAIIEAANQRNTFLDFTDNDTASKTRYFLIGYTYDSEYTSGTGAVGRAWDKFPTINVIIKKLKESTLKDVKIKSIAVISLYEFKSKSDYDAFWKDHID